VQHATMMALKSFGDAVSATAAAATGGATEESGTKASKPRKTAIRRRRKAGDSTFLDEVGNSDEQ
jgi:hypothetical protein